MLNEIQETAAFIRNKIKGEPEFGIILGSGLGGLVNEIQIEYSLDYKDIPNFPVSTVEGHQSKLIYGTLAGKKVIAMQGRFHYYEGYTMQKVVFPVRVMKYLGIKKLVLSNASGGMNANFKIGDLMILNDHINLFPDNPLLGKNINELGPRFPDMSIAYDKDMIRIAKESAETHQIRCHQGVYVGVTGPCFETPAEYKFMRIIGGDAVGMSTVPEVIAARHMGLPCFAISIITDLGGTDTPESVSHEEVLKVAKEAEKKMTKILLDLISKA